MMYALLVSQILVIAALVYVSRYLHDRLVEQKHTSTMLAGFVDSLSEELKKVNSRVDDVAEISSDVYEWKEEIVKIAAKRPTVDLRKREIRHG